MKITVAVAATIAVLAASPAIAQSHWDGGPAYYEGLSTRAIMRSVRLRGLMPVSRPMRRGPHYLVNAVDDYDRLRRVVIDARSGRVLRIEIAARPRWSDRPAGRRFNADPDYAMRPPRAIPRSMPGERLDDLPPEPGEEGWTDTETPRRLPPLRPRASLPGDPELGPEQPRASLPPLRPRSATAPADEPQPPENLRPHADEPPAARPRRSASAPSNPPTPRPRPTTPSLPAVTPPSTPSQSDAEKPEQPASAPAKRTASPRVILPGGPTPKTERAADTPAAAPATKPEPGIPPAQSFE